MKAAIPVGLVILALAGCATLGPIQAGAAGADSGFEPASPAADVTPFPPQNQNIGPQLIIPFDGGTPVIGIPVGGDLFLPVTGGPPVVGISTSP